MSANTNNRHVAVLAFPFASHPGQLLGVVRQLAAAAPEVTFSFISTAKSNRSLWLSGVPNINIRPFDVSDGPPEDGLFSGSLQEEIGLFLKAAPESLRGVVKASEEDAGRPVSCLMSDAFLWFTGDMAVEMQVPWVPLWISATCSLSVHFYTELIRQNVGMSDIGGRENEILKFIPGCSSVRLGDLPSGVVFKDLESPISVMLYKMGKALPQATAVLINSFEELEPPLTQDLKSKFRNLLYVGPCSLTSPQLSPALDEHNCISWLDNQNVASVAYIGFGTVATPPPNELVALAEALETSGTPFLWSLKDNFKQHLPEGFTKRTCKYGKIIPWAPQVQILAHSSIGVHITHCGWGSALESIVAGVPLIGRPFFGDHQLITYIVENVWQIGVRVEGGVFTKNGTMSALELVLSHEKGNKLKEQIGVYKEHALKAVGPNGSSTRDFKTLLEVVTK